MTFPRRSLRDLRNPIGCLILLASFAAAAGCSTATTGGSLVDAGGNHPANFVSIHPDYARPDGSLCMPCHGDDLRGGISKVSCFSASFDGVGCHANGPAFHPLDWLNKTSLNFHGKAFNDNVLVQNLACTVCHDPSHPNAPPGYNCLQCHFDQYGGRVPPGSSYAHGQIQGHTAFGSLDNLNAVTSVCVRCHETNNSFGHMPQPFCHNCHSPAPAGFHPAGWSNPDSHGAAAKAAPGPSTGFGICQNCHGNNFAGSGNAPSCVNNPLCHGSGVDSPHSPAPWRVTVGSPPNARRHTNTDNSVPGNPTACAWCHRGSGSVVVTPPTPPPASPTPGCFNNTLCHGNMLTAPHPVRPYANHPADAKAQFNTVCINCHNIDPPRKLVNAPYCMECHKGGSPFTFTGCASCHGNPPAGAAPVGAVFPNIAGAHAKHNALDNVRDVCNTCHNGGGTGTGLEHLYDNVAGASGIDVAFLNLLFKANAGNLLYTSADLSCSNVSCHGGIKTPGWRGTLPITGDAACRQCHTVGSAQGVPEKNSPYSGLHAFHMNTTVGGAILCTECHNMANGTTGALNHYKFLNTPQMEGPAKDTVEPNGSAANYTAATQTCGNFTCHTKAHSNLPWRGGHDKPYLGAAHTSANTLSNCLGCHVLSAPEPNDNTAAPPCSVCHSNAAAPNPLTTKECISCHGKAADLYPSRKYTGMPVGNNVADYPNFGGRHQTHMDLDSVSTGTPMACGTCHNGIDNGTSAHYQNAYGRTNNIYAKRSYPGAAAFTATYGATSAGIVFTPSTLKCSNVSCHGAQDTPVGWNATGITCKGCHKLSGTSVNGAPANYYNDYTDTWITHNDHISRVESIGGGCTTCHATLPASLHFGSLADKAIASRAAASTVTVFGYPSNVPFPPTSRSEGNCTSTPNGCH